MSLDNILKKIASTAAVGSALSVGSPAEAQQDTTKVQRPVTATVYDSAGTFLRHYEDIRGRHLKIRKTDLVDFGPDDLDFWLWNPTLRNGDGAWQPKPADITRYCWGADGELDPVGILVHDFDDVDFSGELYNLIEDITFTGRITLEKKSGRWKSCHVSRDARFLLTFKGEDVVYELEPEREISWTPRDPSVPGRDLRDEPRDVSEIIVPRDTIGSGVLMVGPLMGTRSDKPIPRDDPDSRMAGAYVLGLIYANNFTGLAEFEFNTLRLEEVNPRDNFRGPFSEDAQTYSFNAEGFFNLADFFGINIGYRHSEIADELRGTVSQGFAEVGNEDDIGLGLHIGGPGIDDVALLYGRGVYNSSTDIDGQHMGLLGVEGGALFRLGLADGLRLIGNGSYTEYLTDLVGTHPDHDFLDGNVLDAKLFLEGNLGSLVLYAGAGWHKSERNVWVLDDDPHPAQGWNKYGRIFLGGGLNFPVTKERK